MFSTVRLLTCVMLRRCISIAIIVGEGIIRLMSCGMPLKIQMGRIMANLLSGLYNGSIRPTSDKEIIVVSRLSLVDTRTLAKSLYHDAWSPAKTPSSPLHLTLTVRSLRKN